METLYHDKSFMSSPSQAEIRRFGEKLHTLRRQRRMTLKELATALGYAAHGHISELEGGKKIPTAEFTLAVARLFDVTTDVLLKDEFNLSADAVTICE